MPLEALMLRVSCVVALQILAATMTHHDYATGATVISAGETLGHLVSYSGRVTVHHRQSVDYTTV